MALKAVAATGVDVYSGEGVSAAEVGESPLDEQAATKSAKRARADDRNTARRTRDLGIKKLTRKISVYMSCPRNLRTAARYGWFDAGPWCGGAGKGY